MGQAGQYYKTPNPKLRFSHDTAKKDGTVKWTVAKGGSQEFVKDEYVILQGGVKLDYQDVTIHADKITYNFKTKDAVAEGHVIIDQGATRLSADRTIYNLDSQTGTFFNATGSFDPSIYLTAEKMEKIGEQTYRITNGLFTSCDLDRPAWSFRMVSGVVTLDDYARFKHLQLRARNVPIFWTPYLVWPTKKDRARGFLIPRLGFSKEFGDRLEVGYFIPFGDSVDVSILGDVHFAATGDPNLGLAADHSAFVGTGVSIRYAPSPNVKIGELDTYTVHDVESGRQQWRYQYRHTQDALPGSFRGVIDIRDFSDLDFFRRFDRDPSLNTLSNIYSSAYLTKNRSNYSLNIIADRRDIFLSTTQKQRFEQEPTLQLRLYPERIGPTPFYFSFESSASHLRTSALNSCAPGDLFCHPSASSIDYNRADIYPRLSMQIHTPSWLSIRPEVSVRQTYYSASLDPNASPSSTFPPQTIDKALSRFYGQGEVDLVGPSLSRVFNKEIGGFSRFKHVIEPRFRYLYTTPLNDQNRVIRFDTVDSPLLPIARGSVEYELVQRIIGKERGPNASSREILSLSLRQTVSIGKAFTNTTNGSYIPSGESQRFTPLTAGLHFNPYQSVTLDANTTVGNVSHQIEQTSLSTNLVGKDRYLGFTWFASYLAPGATTGDSSQIRLNAGSPFLENKLRADVQLNYDAKKGSFLEQRYLVGGNGSCYSIALEYRRFQTYVSTGLKNEWQGSIAVTLKNVGTISAH
jgi:LPS-assembly protein